MKINKLTDIDPKQKYQGYLWWSDATSPEVYQNQQLPEWQEEKSNPFIIEGQLYDKANNKSYSIRFVDGIYLINCFDLNDLNKVECINKEYLPNRFPDGIQKLCFKEIWRPRKDDLCEGMDVLQPAEVVFVGFKKIEL